MSDIPFNAINAAALARLPSLCAEWFPAGRLCGNEFLVGNIEGDPGESLSINVRHGRWSDFAADTRGGDPISLYAAKFTEGSQGAAARALGQKLGVYMNGAGQTQVILKRLVAPKSKAKAAEDWQPMVPPPQDAPAPADRLFDGYDHVYKYKDPAGRILSYMRRRDARGGQDKSFAPLTFGILDGKLDWHTKATPAPRALYGLDKLAARPKASVIIVEGEKADAAAAFSFPSYVTVTWPGGAKAIDRADLSPLAGRRVIIWPDNDVPGHAAAAKPTDGALDNPALGQDEETLGLIATADDLGDEVRQLYRQTVMKHWSGISAVGKQLFEKRELPEQGGQDHQPAIAILHIGRCHQRMQQQPQRIDQDVTLLALDQLAGIEPM